jgi:gold/copper resistance efflux system membrane fusion protein
MRKRSIGGIAALVTVGSIAMTVAAVRSGTPAHAQAAGAAPLPELPVSEVVVRPLEDVAELRGQLAATHVVELRPRVAGFVQKVTFEEGAIVEPGQVLFHLDARQLYAERQRLAADVEQARAKLAYADLELARTDQLVKSGATSSHELDARVATQKELRASVAAGSAALANADLEVSFTRVTAPIRGRVSRALVTAGNLVATGASSAPLATISAVDPIHVVFDIDEPTYLTLASRLHPNTAGRPTVRVGLVNEEGFPREATVDYVDTRIEGTTGTVRVRASMRNADGLLEPGLFTRVSLPTSEARPTVLVDDIAIRTEQDKRYVLVVGTDGTLAHRSVELGPSVGGMRAVRSGLAAGDVVLLKGMARPGMKIKPKHVAMGGVR